MRDASDRGLLNALISFCSCTVPLTPSRQIAEAQAALLRAHPAATEVRDIKVRIKTLRRRARILYLPAYVVDYNFGLSFNSHGERRPKACQAIISGMGKALLLQSQTKKAGCLQALPGVLPVCQDNGRLDFGQGLLLSGDCKVDVLCPCHGVVSLSALLHSQCEASASWRLPADALARHIYTKCSVLS